MRDVWTAGERDTMERNLGKGLELEVIWFIWEPKGRPGWVEHSERGLS